MNKEKTIKIYFEIPEGWVDYNSPTALLSYSIHQEAERQLRKLLEEEYIKRIELEIPKTKITAEEVKARMIDIMAKRALEPKIADEDL